MRRNARNFACKAGNTWNICDAAATIPVNRPGEHMEWLKTIFSNHTFAFFFAVIGVPLIVTGTVEVIRMLIRHRERMAMIGHGMGPHAMANEHAQATTESMK